MDNSFPLNPRTPQFQNFGELLYCAYANLQMLMFALNSGKRRYDRAKPYVVAHYYKQLYLYAKDHALLEKSLEELDAMVLPFNWRYILINFPQPEEFYAVAGNEAFNAENPNEAHERE